MGFLHDDDPAAYSMKMGKLLDSLHGRFLLEPRTTQIS